MSLHPPSLLKAMRRRALHVTVVTALLCAAPSPSRADLPDPQTEEAIALFHQARAAVQQGDLAAALVLFQKSQSRHPSSGTLLNMANCEEQLGLTANAWLHYQWLTAQLPADDERLPLVKMRAAALEPRVPRLQIDLASGAPAGTKVLQDDVELTSPELGVSLPVDPVRHEIVVTAPGRLERRYAVTVQEGKRDTLTVEPGQVAESIAKTAPFAVAPSPSRLSPARTAGFILGGAGLAGLGIGGVTGILSIAKKNEVAHLCPQSKPCTGEGGAIEGTGKAFAAASSVAFAVGLSALGVGTYLVLSNREKPSATAAFAPLLLPSGGGLGANGNF